MKDMDRAIDRIEQAIIKKERILIYGDYDVDGTTSVALVYNFLREYYFYIDYYIPDRHKEGYGISEMGIDLAAERNIQLIIALDCGIKAVSEIEYAKTKNIEFIICDHHRPSEVLPDACAVLDPYRLDCNYPYKELSACGIGFKLIQAFADYNNIPFKKVASHLDLVAVSIAADVVPLTGENRILAYHGLRKLNRSPRAGLKSLIQMSGINRELSVSDIVYVIGPIINAAGRMDDAGKAVKLLISKERIYANDNADILKEQNLLRRQVDTDTTEAALNAIAEDPTHANSKATIVYRDGWHKGVIGIVASRLIERFYRPTIVLTSSKGMVAGSARSVPGFDIYNAISECSDLLEQFGGHTYAAGLTMTVENIPEFIERFNKIVEDTIDTEVLIPEINIDAEVDLRMLNNSFYGTLEKFAPFGPGNYRPIFRCKELYDTGHSSLVGNDRHIRFHVKQENSYPMKGIGFNIGERFESEVQGKWFDLCFSLDKNVWNDNAYLQLNVKDIKTLDPEVDFATDDSNALIPILKPDNGNDETIKETPQPKVDVAEDANTAIPKSDNGNDETTKETPQPKVDLAEDANTAIPKSNNGNGHNIEKPLKDAAEINISLKEKKQTL